MKQLKGAKRASLIAAFFLTAGLLSACAAPVHTVRAMPEGMRGNIQIADVQVESHSGVRSTEIKSALRNALVEELDRTSKKGPAMNLVVVIESYHGPENQVGGTWLSKVTGVKSHLRGRVKVVDPGDGSVVAEFRPFAEYDGGGLMSGVVDFTPVQSFLVDQFTASVVDEIS